MYDDITIAQKIVGGTHFNISNNSVFHNDSVIYKSTNEKLSNINKYLKERENILTVISSGDQIINSILEGITNIDAFDISRFPKYFLFLKLAAIKKLNREEYIKFFFESPTTSIIYDDWYGLIREKLNYENRQFWDSLFDFYDWYDIYNSTLFSSEFLSETTIKRENEYLSNYNYSKLKEMIDHVNINIYRGNIFNLNEILTKKYDIIYLSNIINYVDKIEYKKLLDKLSLKDKGIILTYFYEIKQNIKDFFLEENYSFDSFNNSKSGVMVYKK